MPYPAKVIPFLTFLLILALTVIAIAEAGLQVFAKSSSTFENVIFPNKEYVLPDAKLLHKGNPRIFEHDENGFRNPSIPTHAQIVAIGDSHTYGTSVSSGEAWPKILARVSGCEVYSMSLGGYGPLQYAELARDAIHLKPRLMIIGIYFGNDFYDNWQMFRSNPKKYPVPQSILRAANDLESISPLEEKVIDLFPMGGAKLKSTVTSSVRRFLSSNSALYGFARAIKNQLGGMKSAILDRSFKTAVSALSSHQLQYASVFDGQEWRTIFTAGYRFAVEDTEDSRILLGRWLTKWAIEDIRNTARSVGARTLFILMPTKESVFAPKVKEKKKHTYFQQLAVAEDLHRSQLVEFMVKGDIDHLDARRVLETLSDQPYFENADGHPNRIGHEVIANSISTETPPCGDNENAIPRDAASYKFE